MTESEKPTVVVAGVVVEGLEGPSFGLGGFGDGGPSGRANGVEGGEQIQLFDVNDEDLMLAPYCGVRFRGESGNESVGRRLRRSHCRQCRR